MKLHHMGIIVKDIQKAIAMYRAMGYTLEKGPVLDHIQNNVIAFLCGPSPRMELIEPLGEQSSVYHFKAGYHHMCYEAEEGEHILQAFRSMQVGKIFTPPIVAPALGGREVAFACLQNGTFVEFIL
ncbi:MAG: VOC family protein [Clostridia bacterium]|nr:VOC family protein [Clostridia bacterium]